MFSLKCCFGLVCQNVFGTDCNYLCNQCLSPLTLWVQILLRQGVLNTTLCDTVCQWLVAGRWLSPGTPVSSNNITDRHWNIVENGVKHHNPNPVIYIYIIYILSYLISKWKMLIVQILPIENVYKLYRVFSYIHVNVK